MKPRTSSFQPLTSFYLLLTWAALMLPPAVAASQETWPDSVDVIRLEFKSLPPLVRRDTSHHFRYPDYAYYIYPPYAIHHFLYFEELSFYRLLRNDIGRMFNCAVMDEGIAFYPEILNPSTDPVTNLTWRKDTIRGFPVFETYRYVKDDTLRSWNTDAFQMDLSGYAFMKGVPLYIERMIDGEIHSSVLHKADTIRMASRYFDPAQSNAPVRFDSHHLNFISYPVANAYIPDLLRYTMPNFSGKDVFTGKKWSMKSLQSRIVPLVFMDYTRIGRIPSHLRDWLLSVRQEPDVTPIVFCLDSKKEIEEALEKDPSLKAIPHIPLPPLKYYRIVGYVPLYTVILDHGGVIDYHCNGFQLFSTDDMTGTIDRLRQTWKKGTQAVGQDH